MRGEAAVRGSSAGAIGGVIIETERLRLRAYGDDDLADLVTLAGQLGGHTLDGDDTAPLQRSRWARVDNSRTGESLDRPAAASQSR